MLHSAIHLVFQRTFVRKTALLVLTALLAQWVLAQMPVQVATQVLPPYSLKLSDYYNGTTPKLIVTATNQDLSKPVLEVRLRMTITGEGNGVKIVSRDNVYYPTIFLDAGIPVRLTLSDFTHYFNADNLLFQGGISREKYLQGGKLPEGFYSIAFDAVEVNSRQVVSSPSVARFWASLSDPPLLNQPAKETLIAEKNPTNIVFNWTPRHLNSPNSAFNTEYRFQIVEITDPRINPLSAFETSRPLYETTTRSTSLVYGPAEPLLIAGRRYAWRVRAREVIGSDDADVFKNNGFSEVYWFNYAGKCVEAPPVNVQTLFQNGELIFSWDNDPDYQYSIRSRTIIGNTTAKNEQLTGNQYKIKVTPGSAIEYSLGSACLTSTTVKYTDIRQFTAPSKNTVSGKIMWAFRESEERFNDPASSLLSVSLDNSEQYASVSNSDDKPGTQRTFPLEGATVQLHATKRSTNQNTWIGSITAETKKDGSYRFDLPFGFRASDYINYYLAITSSRDHYDEGMMTYVKWPLKNLNASDFGYQMGIDTLSAQTTRFKPLINCASCTNAQDASIDVLMKEQEWIKYRKYYQVAGMGQDPTAVGRRNIVQYNSEDYIIITTLTSGKSYNYLFNNRSSAERYIVRVNYKGKPSVFYPLRSFAYKLSFNQHFAPITVYSKSFSLRSAPRAEGIVTYKKAPLRDAVVKALLQIGTAQPKEYSTTTDAQGYYRIDLPVVNDLDLPNAKLTLSASDFSTANSSSETVKFSTVTKKDFAFSAAPVFLLVGRVVDQLSQPVRNALVTVEGTSQSTRTSADGFYAIKAYKQTPSTIKITNDDCDPLTLTYTPRKIDANAGDEQYTADLWATRIERLAVVQAYLKANRQTAASADLLGIGSGSLQTVYPTYMRPTESLKDIVSLDVKQIKVKQGTLNIIVQLDGRTVKAKLKIVAGPEHILQGNDIIGFQKGKYAFELSTQDDAQAFLPVQGEFQITGETTTKVSLRVYPGINVNGVVVDKKTGNPLAGASIAAKGLPYTTKANAQGNFSFLLPANREVSLAVEKEKYSTVDTIFTFTKTATLRLRMEAFSGEMPKIDAISGYPVQIENIASINQSTYVVSGKMEVASNDIFTPDANSTKLTFKRLSVKLDEESNKFVPLADIQFEEAVMKTTAFGFAPVEVLGYPNIKLSALKNKKGDYTYENGTIGGLELKLLMSTAKNVSKIPIRIHDALLVLDDSSVVQQQQGGLDTARKKFAYVYTPPNFKINALGPDKEFKIQFLASDTSRSVVALRKDTDKSVNADYYKSAIGWVSSFYIRKDSAVLNKDGINLNGYVQFPVMANTTVSDSGKVVIEKFLIGKDFTLQQLTLRVSERRPLIARFQKIEARLTKFSVFGLGTPNVGIGVGGIILLKKDSAGATGTAPNGSTATVSTSISGTASPALGGATNSTNKSVPPANTAVATNTKGHNDTLFIHELNFVNKDEGITVDGKLAFGQRGIGLRSLVFSNPVGTYIGLSYNFTEKSFIVDGSGLLRYDRTRNGNGKTPASTPGKDTAVNSIFPIEIQKFEYKSKDGSFLMAAKSNITIGFKVFKLRVERLLVSVGSDASIDQMNSYLVSGTAQGKSIGTGGPDEPLDESKCSWAIGVSGGLEFMVKGFPSSLKGSIIVGNLNDQIQVRVNEIALDIKQANFEVSAAVKISLDPEKWGFEGEGTFTSLAKQLTASAALHFYKLPTGIDLGASVKVSTAIVTGPIMWHALGGGFRFNTAENIYSVKLLGDVGPAGTPKTTGYVKDAFVEVLFDANNCGAKPVVCMGGKLNLMEKDMAQVTGTFDFCRTLMLVTLKTEPIPVPGVPGIMAKLDGTLFGLAQSDAKMLILNVNADFSTMGADLLKGNLSFALGFNYNNNHQYAPQEIRDRWNTIEYEAKNNNGTVLNGVAVSGNVSIPGKSGGFNVSLAGLNIASASYSFGGSGSMKLFHKFTDKTFKFAADVSAYVKGDIRVLGSTYHGRGDVRMYLEGGYGSRSEEERESRLKNMEIEMANRLANPQPLDQVTTGLVESEQSRGYKSEGSLETGITANKFWRGFKVPVFYIGGKNVPIENTYNSIRDILESKASYSYTLNTNGKSVSYMEVHRFKGTQYNCAIYVNDHKLAKIDTLVPGDGSTTFGEFYKIDPRWISNQKVVVKVEQNGFKENPFWLFRLKGDNKTNTTIIDEVALGSPDKESTHNMQAGNESVGSSWNGRNSNRRFVIPIITINGEALPPPQALQKFSDLTDNYSSYSFTLDTRKQKAFLTLDMLENKPYNYNVSFNGNYRINVNRQPVSTQEKWTTQRYEIPAQDVGGDGKVTIKVERGRGSFLQSPLATIRLLPDNDVWKQQEQQRINREMAQRVSNDQNKAWYLNGGAGMRVSIYNDNSVSCNDIDWLMDWKICIGFNASFKWRQGENTIINVSR